MKTLIILAGLFSASLAAQNPSGTFSCPLQYKETYAISIGAGEDFPTFGGHYDSPRLREENLLVKFSLKEKKPHAYIINPEALPNWLLIGPSYYDSQESYSYPIEDGIFYQVSWHGTWYFGSGLDLETTPLSTDTLKIDITFNDNDSVGELHRGVICRKLR
jgi:hypothetical protein